jgi:hypothetical protein
LKLFGLVVRDTAVSWFSSIPTSALAMASDGSDRAMWRRRGACCDQLKQFDFFGTSKL